MKFVITGGPCSGKTTVIKALQKKGYNVISETAKMLIEKESAGKNKIFPWTNPEAFQKRIFSIQLKKEKKLLKQKIYFLDRSLIDNIAYRTYKKIKIPKFSKPTYDTIFLLAMLPRKYWNKNPEGKPRMETYAVALKLHKEISNTYKKLGYSLKKIPVMTVNRRAALIEKIAQGKK
jgi:predicted ATPase